jgi:signal transduction histidine kinase
MMKPKVLVVDDRRENLLAVRSVIELLEVDIFEAGSGEEALRLVLQHDFAVILLDVQMPGTGGFETAEIIRSRQRTRHTPIIFVTAGDSGETSIVRGYALGAVDYIVKPFVPEILRWKVSVFAQLYVKSQQAQELSHEQAARQEWEAAAKRSALIADITVLLASSMDYGATIGRIPERFVPEFAEWATVVSAAENPTILSQIVPGVTPVVQPADSRLFEMLGVADRGPGDTLIVPLRGHDVLVAAIVLFRASPLQFTAPDRLMADDLTERAALAITNALLFEEIQAASRAKDQFLAIVSHELRTPLNAIAGWTQILQQKQLSPEARDKALATIEQNARIQDELIGDILDISRIVAGQLSVTFEDIELDAIVRTSIDSLKPTADAKEVSLNFDCEENLPRIAGDPKRLRQVFWNLLTNAIKFTPPNGSVDVLLDTTASHVRLQVRDSGAGIKRELLARIFEVFFQADTSFKRPHGGLGLGLAITRHLVELHGGTITADSAGEGQGAVFTVMLPIRHARQRAS